MINVTKTFTAPLEEYTSLLQEIWDTGWMTNRGKFVNKLEDGINDLLGTKHVIAMTNGTLPIQIAIKALNLTGEIITTPFSYVATTSSIVWEGCKPVFVDIHPEYLTIDDSRIEEAITTETTGILATHVYGNPCNVENIEKIALKYNLKVIYDAAHCFGVSFNGKSIFNYGDVSTCSFHATKVFHTSEGGAAFCNDSSLYDRLFSAHNFGHESKESFDGIGINAKMSELQAIMGVVNLPYITEVIKDRKMSADLYENVLGGSVQLIKFRKGTTRNYSYMPIIFQDEKTLLRVVTSLNNKNINPRRYFNPSLNLLPYVEKQDMSISEDISLRVLCLPLYYGLDRADVMSICNIILQNL